MERTRTPRVMNAARRAWYDLTKEERSDFEKIASANGLPGIYFFIRRYIMAVNRGRGHKTLLTFGDKLPD